MSGAARGRTITFRIARSWAAIANGLAVVGIAEVRARRLEPTMVQAG